MLDFAPLLVQFLKHQKFLLSTEKHLQEQMFRALYCFENFGGVTVEREFDLDGNKSIIDFLIGGDCGIEVKIHCNKRQIYKQLVRYCETNKLKTLILYSSTTVGLPKTINGVDIYVINPSHAWL